jgi:hypothetical protein
MTISTLTMSILLLLVLSLAAVAILSLILVFQFQTRLMRIFSEMQGVSAGSMEGKLAPSEPVAAKARKTLFSMPLPGADFLRSMRQAKK